MIEITSYLSPKCSIGHSDKNNLGVFANSLIDKGEVISIWGGGIFDTLQLKKMSKKIPHLFTHSVGIYEGFHLCSLKMSTLENVDRFNHCCEPNAGIKGQIILIARKKIKPGEEVCFDYETTDIAGYGGYPFLCQCNSTTCRKIITGESWKDKEFQQKNRGFFSWYLQEKINKFLKKNKKTDAKRNLV